MDLISLRATGPFEDVFYSGINLAAIKYSIIFILLRASVISAVIFSLRYALDFSIFLRPESLVKV
jgi:hypothetical protein